MNKKQYVKYLNNIYGSCGDYTRNEIIEKFKYLCNSKRGKHCKLTALIRAHETSTMGTLICNLDPEYFEIGFDEYNQ